MTLDLTPDFASQVMAEALRVNTSLQGLYLYENQAVDQTDVDAAFVQALQINPDRPARSDWWLYSADWGTADYRRLAAAADQLGHPSLQVLLVSRIAADTDGI